MEALESAELLEKASLLWANCRKQFRDGMLEVGRLLHQFIVARISEATSTEALRIQQGKTRKGATAAAAKKLGVEVPRINDLIVTAMAADLLSGGELGNLSWSEVRCFRLTICRNRGGIARSKRDGGKPVIATETWLVRDGLEVSAPQLFHRVVEEGWKIDRVRKEIAKLVDPLKVPSAPAVHHGPYQVEEVAAKVPVNLTALARECGPKDLAGMIVEMVRNSLDPASVMALVEEMLAESPVGANGGEW